MTTFEITGVTPIAITDTGATSDNIDVQDAIQRVVDKSLESDTTIDVITVVHDTEGAVVTLYGTRPKVA